MKFLIKNIRGDALDLINNEYCFIENLDKQTAASADISSISYSGFDGDVVTEVKAQPRELIFDLRIKSGIDVEEAKRAILKVAKFKRKLTVEWEQNARNVKIEGIISNIEMARWNNTALMQIYLYCSEPYWTDMEEIIQDINEALPSHYFTNDFNEQLIFPDNGIVFGEYDRSRTRKIHNAGDVDTGLKIEILAYDTVTNPVLFNDNGQYFGIGSTDKPFIMTAGQIVKINTTKGNKTVTMNGVSLLPFIKQNSKWIQMEAGDNVFTINSDDENVENMTFALSYTQKYV